MSPFTYSLACDKNVKKMLRKWRQSFENKIKKFSKNFHLVSILTISISTQTVAFRLLICARSVKGNISTGHLGLVL